MFPKEFITYQETLYWIYRKVKHSQVVEGAVQDLKEFWHCDMVVRNRFNNDDTLLFLREISEANVIS